MNKKLKILYVIPYYVPAYSYGGPLKVVQDLAEKMVNDGHSVTVLTTDTLDHEKRIHNLKEVVEGVEVIRFRNISNILAKKLNFYLPIGFKKWVKNNISNYDVVHCHDFFTLLNIWTAKYCRKYKVSYFISPHGCLDLVRQKSKSYYAKKLFILSLKWILSEAKCVIALTRKEKKDILEIDNTLDSKIQIIPNGINLEEFEGIESINLRKKYNLSSDTTLYLFFGRIQYIKGIDITLDVLSRIEKQNYHFFIVGPSEGGEKERLQEIVKKKKLADKVTFVGPLYGLEKKRFIKSCDLFIFLSRSEGLPVAILEVSALGVPSILSDQCNVPEIAEGGGGIEVSLFSDRSTILRCLDTNWQKKSKKLPIIIKENFDLNSVISKTTDLYSSCFKI